MGSAPQASDRLGPIDYQIIEFAGGVLSGAGFRLLLGLVDARLVQVLDLEFVAKDADGVVTSIAAHDVPHGPGDDIDMAVFDGACSGILDSFDLGEVGAGISAGSIAAVLVYEELTMLPVLAAWESAGATLRGSGPILPDGLIAPLEAADGNSVDGV